MKKVKKELLDTIINNIKSDMASAMDASLDKHTNSDEIELSGIDMANILFNICASLTFDLFEALSAGTGVPVKNICQDYEPVFQHYKKQVEDKYKVVEA
jgi:hypothetical protein